VSAVVTRREDGYCELRFTFRRSVVDALKLRIPAHARTWDPGWKIWTVSPEWRRTAIDLMVEAFGFEHVQIVDQEPQRDPEPTSSLRSDPAFMVLHLRESAPPELIQAAYKTLARLAHPDTGGDTLAMQRINRAYDDLKERGLVAGARR
jgi:hypothetical protein